MADNYVKKFELKGVRGVGMWAWDSNSSHCGICKNSLSEKCLSCNASNDCDTSANCSLVWGTCNHAYHSHCMAGWLQHRSVCPMCSGAWEIQRVATV